MSALTLRLDEDQHARLRKEAKLRNCSIAEVLRRRLDDRPVFTEEEQQALRIALQVASREIEAIMPKTHILDQSSTRNLLILMSQLSRRVGK